MLFKRAVAVAALCALAFAPAAPIAFADDGPDGQEVTATITDPAVEAGGTADDAGGVEASDNGASEPGSGTVAGDDGVSDSAEAGEAEAGAESAGSDASDGGEVDTEEDGNGADSDSEESAAKVNVSTFDELKDALAAAQAGATTRIVLAAGTYEFTQTLPVNSDVVLESDGEATLTPASSIRLPMVKVAQGAALTVKGSEVAPLAFDGKGQQIHGGSDYYFVESAGKLVIDGAVFQNAKYRGNVGAAPIGIVGKDASIHLKSGEIRSNDYSEHYTSYSAGAVMLKDGASMVMDGGSINNNQASNYLLQGKLVWSDSPGAGGVYVDNGSSFVMNAGSISKNTGWGGGVLLGSADPYFFSEQRGVTDPANLKPVALATAVFNGGKISENKGVGGAGISGNGNVDIRIPKGSTLEVTNNVGYQGGGIFISDWFVDGIGLTKTHGNVPIEEWSKAYRGGLLMEGGLVEGNIAINCGGGINVSTNGATIKGGVVRNNISGDQGGGIYLTTVPYTLHIESAFIGENTADLDFPVVMSDGVPLHPKSGGGVWLCPTGSAFFYAENGATFWKNKADAEGADLWSSPSAPANTYAVTLPDRTISGAKVSYFDDLAGKRYPTGSDEPRRIVDVSDKLGIAAAFVGQPNTETAAKEARALSALIIENNSSSKGGGIGSNGNIIFGSVPTKPLKEVEIVKAWGEGTTPEDIEVELRGKVGSGDSAVDFLVEKVKLTKESGFKATVADLPETIGGQPIEDVLYVKELNAEGYQTDISAIKAQPTSQTLTFGLYRPEVSELENQFAGYQDNPEAFDEEAWDLKDFEVAYNLHVDGSDQTYTQKAPYSGYQFTQRVTFADVQLPSAGEVTVEYYEPETPDQKYGSFISNSLLSYDLYLVKNDGGWVLRVPKIYPNVVKSPTGDEKVLQVENLSAKPGPQRFAVTLTNNLPPVEPPTPPTPPEPPVPPTPPVVPPTPPEPPTPPTPPEPPVPPTPPVVPPTPPVVPPMVPPTPPVVPPTPPVVPPVPPVVPPVPPVVPPTPPVVPPTPPVVPPVPPVVPPAPPVVPPAPPVEVKQPPRKPVLANSGASVATLVGVSVLLGSAGVLTLRRRS